jgi:hypothetical protein
MKTFQPFQDSVTLLAGGRVYRSARPDDRIQHPEQHQVERRIQRLVQAQLTRLLLAVGIAYG